MNQSWIIKKVAVLATNYSYIYVMSKKDKLKERFLSMPVDFHYDEMVRLLGYFGYEEMQTGKTSGSRVKFKNKSDDQIKLHKPHPSGIMKKYQLKQIKEKLEL